MKTKLLHGTEIEIEIHKMLADWVRENSNFTIHGILQTNQIIGNRVYVTITILYR